MMHDFTKRVGLVTAMTFTLLLSAHLPAVAQGTGGGFGNFKMPLVSTSDSFAFTRGQLSIKSKGGAVKLKVDGITVPTAGSSGILVISVLVNGEAEDAGFVFDVEGKGDDGEDGDENGAVSRIRVKASLTDELELESGDVVEFLTAKIAALNESEADATFNEVATVGFIFEDKPGKDSDNGKPEANGQDGNGDANGDGNGDANGDANGDGNGDGGN